jgi:hypothetical protein
MVGVLHKARAVGTVGRGGKMEAMATDLEEVDVVEEGEHDVGQGPREGRAHESAPGNPPGEVRQANLDLGGGGWAGWQ